jgi:hypothetical protein
MRQCKLFVPSLHIRTCALAVLIAALLFSSCKELFESPFDEIEGNYTGRYIKIDSGKRMVGVTDTILGIVYFTERLVHDTTIIEAFTVGVSKKSRKELQITADIPLFLLSDLQFPFEHEPSGLYKFSSGTSYPFGYRSEDVDVEIDANTERLTLKLVSQNYHDNSVTHFFEGVRQ